VQKNFFAVKVEFFCLWLGFCFCFCMVFLGLFSFALWCGSAWFVVRFNMVCGVVSRWSPSCLGMLGGSVAERL